MNTETLTIGELAERYTEAAAAAKEATERAEALKSALKGAIYDQANLAVTGGTTAEYGGYKIDYRTMERFDTVRFRKEFPDFYVKYTKPSSTWYLSKAKG